MKFELRFSASTQKRNVDLAKGLSRKVGVGLLQTYFKNRDINEINSSIKWSDEIYINQHYKNVVYYCILFNSLEDIYEYNLQEVFKDTNFISVEVPEGFLIPFIKIRHKINHDTGVSTELEYYVNNNELIKYWYRIGCPLKHPNL